VSLPKFDNRKVSFFYSLLFPDQGRGEPKEKKDVENILGVAGSGFKRE